ncbi:hypothetical protein [Mycobacterium sp.]|uniref:hypothetical protein n=1 Tax=Mycobacterium sp. TaxID=1785 RepID=UPI00333F9753
MKSLRLYAIGRIGFGIASLAVPAVTGRTLAGPGGALPDAQAFLRGMGGREIGLGLGLLAAIRCGDAVRPWVVAALMADSADLVGIAGAWRDMPPTNRWIGLGSAGAAAAAGVGVLASLPR